MTLPPLNPETTTAGIAVDPKTLDRVVPATRRSDGTLVKTSPLVIKHMPEYLSL
jgi:partner of Y14 and mago